MVGGARQQSGMGKEVSMATLQATTTKGTVTLNPISGILTKPSTYQREGSEGKKGLKRQAGKTTFLTSQLASKCKAHHKTLPAKSSKVTSEPRREVTADWHCLGVNFA